MAVICWLARQMAKNAYVDCDTYFLHMNLFIADVGARNRVGNCRAVERRVGGMGGTRWWWW
jgi:hypothetical protein